MSSVDSKFRWYMITVVSGKEKQVIDSIKLKAKAEKLEDFFEAFEVMTIPHVTPLEMKKKLKGQEYKVRYKNLYPGYIFIKMVMSNNTWFLTRNTQYVTGIVGSSGSRTKPTPISQIEFNKMKRKVEKIKKDFDLGIVESPFKPGVIVEVIDGPAKGQVGPVVETDDKRHVSIVELIMFGRKTATEIEHWMLKVKK